MTYRYLEHMADMGIESEGDSLCSAIEDGALAVLNLFFDLNTITEKSSITVRARAGSIEALFVEVLNELISLRDRDQMALKRLITTEFTEEEGSFSYRGEAYGEPFDMENHAVKSEVKAATYSGLRYEEVNGRHILRCLLDM